MILKETDFFPLLQMTLESKVHFSLPMPRIKAEPTKTIAVALHDKYQTKTLADLKNYASFPLYLSSHVRPIDFLTKWDYKNPMENLTPQSIHLNKCQSSILKYTAFLNIF